ncbi:MAG: ribonuclease D [Gammaproteobacteria bacterium]|nr:MAG: ribonuclease D [Gammaproteobacteria bacterium]
MSANRDILYVETAAELETLCGQLTGAQWMTLDTEFLREKTYYPKLCLLQLAVPGVVACIDPLAIEDISPILDVIYDENITKVMHAARQDMEILYHLRGTLPAPVFDTQVAALLLGLPDQVGYGTLVGELLGVTLDKLHTRADWSQRPLSPEQIRYAADDVIYLAQAYERLVARLGELGRLDWLTEDFERLVQPELYSNPPGQAWLKVRGINRIKGPSLSVLQVLAAWRESLAQQLDRPRGWLLRDDVLLDIARQMPGNLAALGKIRGLSERVVNRNGKHILGLIAEARNREPEPLPVSGPRRRLRPEQEALVDALMAVVRLSALENSLNPAVLATRKQLESLVADSESAEVMRGWRGKLAGDRLQALLDGDLALQVTAGKLNLVNL